MLPAIGFIAWTLLAIFLAWVCTRQIPSDVPGKIAVHLKKCLIFGQCKGNAAHRLHEKFTWWFLQTWGISRGFKIYVAFMAFVQSLLGIIWICAAIESLKGAWVTISTRTEIKEKFKM